MASKNQRDAEEALAFLRERIQPGDKLYTNVAHVARSGMSRSIQVFLIRDNEPMNVSAFVARAVGLPVDRDRLAVKVGGCGMDVGAHAVYEVGARLYGKGFGCIGDRCPSSDHVNGDRDYTPHDPDAWDTNDALASGVDRMHAIERAQRTGKRHHWHTDGGYALRRVWL